jgi:hypothetical protein
MVWEIPKPICKPTISPPTCIPARINLKKRERRKKIRKSKSRRKNNARGESGKGILSFISGARAKDRTKLKATLTLAGK